SYGASHSGCGDRECRTLRPDVIRKNLTIETRSWVWPTSVTRAAAAVINAFTNAIDGIPWGNPWDQWPRAPPSRVSTPARTLRSRREAWITKCFGRDRRWFTGNPTAIPKAKQSTAVKPKSGTQLAQARGDAVTFLTLMAGYFSRLLPGIHNRSAGTCRPNMTRRTSTSREL